MAGTAVALALGGTGCGLFETRSPVDPGGNTFPCSSLEDPNNVFDNLRKSFGQGAGLTCYTDLFDPTFFFHGDPTDSTDAPPQFTSWDEVVEAEVGQAVANNATDVAVTYTAGPVIVTTNSVDYEIRRYTYEIVFKGSVIPSDTLFQGIAEITIRKSTTGLWQITEWFDRRDPAGTTTRTWGYLRASYRI